MIGQNTSPITCTGVLHQHQKMNGDLFKIHICDNHEECYHDPLGNLERRKSGLYQARDVNVHVAIFLIMCLYTQALKHVKSSMMSSATKLTG